MMAAIGPADYNFDETIGTLRYANRAKNIKNKPKINEDPKDAMIREFQDEIDRLTKQLQQQGGAVMVEESEEQLEIEGVDPALLEQIKSQKEEEVMAVLKEKGILEEERIRIAEQLHQFKENERKRQQEKDELMAKLSSMQQQLLVGGVNLLDKHQLQEQQLRMQEQELQQKAMEEKRLKRELALKEEEVSLQEEKYASLTDEVSVKTKKLQKLWNQVQANKSEIQDLQVGGLVQSVVNNCWCRKSLKLRGVACWIRLGN
jgi:kinesin family protein 3/17